MTQRSKILSDTYDSVAFEYYDEVRHPTCANFGELSSRFVDDFLSDEYDVGVKTILEVGAGRSTVAPLLRKRKHDLKNLLLVDNSSSMLNHSRPWLDLGAKAIQADARRTGLANSSVDIIVASLGDPYNGPEFWGEVGRILRPSGRVAFTSPSPEWSNLFRDPSDQKYSEFIVSGQSILLPSLVPTMNEQLEWLRSNHLVELGRKHYGIRDLRKTTASKKLFVFPAGEEKSVLFGIVAERLG